MITALLLLIAHGLSWVPIGAVIGHIERRGYSLVFYQIFSCAVCVAGGLIGWATSPEVFFPRSGCPTRTVVLVVSGVVVCGIFDYLMFLFMGRAMKRGPNAIVWYSTHEYEALRPAFQNNQSHPSIQSIQSHHVLLLSGIASPEQMLIDLQTRAKQITPLSFSDHHDFSNKDILHINEVFAGLPSPKIIITTEKDETRLLNAKGLSDEVKRNLYVLPVRIKFMLDQEETFNKSIINYVRKNSRNSILAKSKDDNKPKDSNHSGDRPRTISFRNN